MTSRDDAEWCRAATLPTTAPSPARPRARALDAVEGSTGGVAAADAALDGGAEGVDGMLRLGPGSDNCPEVLAPARAPAPDANRVAGAGALTLACPPNGASGGTVSGVKATSGTVHRDSPVEVLT